jgi:hypothetical protein
MRTQIETCRQRALKKKGIKQGLDPYVSLHCKKIEAFFFFCISRDIWCFSGYFKILIRLFLGVSRNPELLAVELFPAKKHCCSVYYRLVWVYFYFIF